MPARKTKTFSWKEVSFPLLLTLAGLGTVVTLYASGLFSLTTASNAGTIQETDKVTVDGVNNTTQYLTSMVLHAPGTDEKVILSYDPELNALRIKGAVNADGLIIGNNEASVGNTVLGGTNNQATQGTNTNSLIVGGENNKLNNASNSAIIGGQNNTLLNTENVAVIGSSQTTFPAGEKRENIFIVGGVGNQVKGSNVFILGEGQNVAGSDMVLMGKKIKA